MSGKNFRVAFEADENIRYRMCNTEEEARSIASAAIHQGTVSQVAVQENRNGQWVPANKRTGRK